MKIHESAEILANQVFQAGHADVQDQSKKTKVEVSQNIKNLNKTQSQSFQSLKMQSLGAFAGNFVHDLNNIFNIIQVSSSLLEMNKLNQEKSVEIFKSIKNAVEHGAEIVGQIITFTGQTDVSLKPLSIPTFIYNTLSQLKQSLPANIRFQEIIDQSASYINADQSKLQQVLLNLCVNARDAMPKGGTITIRVNNVTNHDLQPVFPAAEYDRYICISISDTGTGIEEKVKDKIFDPFFTTKGKGRGLGLSAVYGIVKAHHGFIDVESELSKGSTFYLYFPLAGLDKKNNYSQQIKMSDGFSGSETILVIEDEKPLLDLAHLIFRSKGYNVITAEDGIEAVEIYNRHRDKISLVFSDIGLPGISGREVFAKLKEINPNVKVIFTSGIFVDIKAELLKDGAKDFIQKPYRQEDVLQSIREVLDAN